MQYHLRCGMVTMRSISTFKTIMRSSFQPFTDNSKAIGASLACAIWVDFSKVDPTLPTNPLRQRQELPEGSINTIFSQHPSRQPSGVEVFCKDSLRLVAKIMSYFKVKVFATVCNPMMHSGNFDLRLFPILRTLLFSCRSALQQFQLALHRLEKLGALVERAVRSRQESLQSQVNPNRSTMNWGIWNRHLRFNRDDYIPLRCSHPRQDSHLLHFESIGSRAMQVDGHFPDFWQLDEAARCGGSPRCSDCRSEAVDGVVFELRKHKRFELTKLFETRESMPTLLKRFPSIVQSANRRLQNLRMHLAQMWELLLSFGQVVLLTMIGRERLISRDNIFLFQRTSVYGTLTRSNPVFELAQGLVIHASAHLKPLQQFNLLSGIWIDSVGVVHGQHSHSLLLAMTTGKCLSHPH
jgi:hypothetical protein